MFILYINDLNKQLKLKGSIKKQKSRKLSIRYFELKGSTIGQGTFGKVKKAIHNQTGQLVAIKILQKSKIIDVADVQRVSRQIHILKIIRHPNIIQLYEIIQTSKHLFLVTQYAQEGQLFQHIVKQKKIPQIQACKYFQQLINAIQYLHTLHIVHRDLKPQNILINHQRQIKVIDFGLSNTYNPNETLKTACGSPCYAAPQMIKGNKYLGTQVDIWSAGVILYAMICGFLPFQDPNTTKLYNKILNCQYEIPDFISQQAKNLLKCVLELDPKKRITINEIRKHKWWKINSEPKATIGLLIGYNRIPIDKNIMKQTCTKLSIIVQQIMICNI